MSKVPKFLIYIFVFIIGICSAFALWAYIEIRKVDRQNPEEVVSAFAHSLRNNDEQRAKSLVSMEKWQELEIWNNQHEAVPCKQSLYSAGSSEWIVKYPDKELAFRVNFDRV